MKFNDLNWHDAVIKSLRIDRSDPGNKDTVVFEIEWPEEKGDAFIIFEEVYWVKMNLNFGIVADETILNATELDGNDHDIEVIYSKWKGALNDVKLKAYKFNLNSTGGEIKIIARRVREVEL